MTYTAYPLHSGNTAIMLPNGDTYHVGHFSSTFTGFRFTNYSTKQARDNKLNQLIKEYADVKE